MHCGTLHFDVTEYVTNLFLESFFFMDFLNQTAKLGLISELYEDGYIIWFDGPCDFIQNIWHCFPKIDVLSHNDKPAMIKMLEILDPEAVTLILSVLASHSLLNCLQRILFRLNLHLPQYQYETRRGKDLCVPSLRLSATFIDNAQFCRFCLDSDLFTNQCKITLLQLQAKYTNKQKANFTVFARRPRIY